MADISTVKAITDQLENGVKDLFESDKYAAYLQTMSRFHRYSTRNTLLIHLQMPSATRVAGYNSWKNNFSRQVKKGEKGIKIFAPMPFVVKEELEKLDPVTKQPIIGADGMPVMEEYVKMQSARFKTVSVFDVSQTDGEPLPTLAENITGNVTRYELFMDALRAVSPLPIQLEDLPEDTDGTCYFGDRIAIRSGMSEIQTVSAVIHEIAHAKLHDLQAIKDSGEQRKDRRTEEVEAESLSFACCQYYKIETGANTFGYIAEWSKGRELKELNASLDTIRKVAAELIDGIDKHYRDLAKERGIDLTAAALAPEAVIASERSNEPEQTTYTRGGLKNDTRLTAVRERYGENSFEYETLKKEMELSFEEYAALLNRLDAELHNRGHSAENGGYTSQDYMNDYIDEVDLRPAAEDVVKIADYMAGKTKTPTIARNIEPTPETSVSDDVTELLNAYARNAEVSNSRKVGSVALMTPVFNDGNFNREGKKIFVGVEEPAGKYQIFSRNEGERSALYFLTASGMIDHTSGYFRDVWDEEKRQWMNHRPTEAELDEVIPQIAERFGRDMADPTRWAMYQHAAVLNRIDECEAHNIPVRKLREEESKQREADAERERQEEKKQKREKYDARVDKIAKAVEKNGEIRVRYDEYEFDGRNPVLDLFKLYGVDLPLRTQGWVNTGLTAITGSGYSYRSKKPSEAFGERLYSLRKAIQLTPIEQLRQGQQPADKTEVRNTVDSNLYAKFAELFPNFASGKYSYMRLESDGFEPLSLEWIGDDRLSVMHTYTMNGDLMYDPMMTFEVDRDALTMSAAEFEQSMPPLYQRVKENGGGISVDGNGNEQTLRNLQISLNGFASKWLGNIAKQGYMPVKANLVLGEDEEIQVTFDKDGNVIMPEPEKQYDLGYGFLGNGITVWNKAEEVDGDYKTVAHIATDRTVTFYDDDMPHEVRQQIDTVANSPDTQAFDFAFAPENIPPHIDGSPAPASVYEAVKRVIPEIAEPKTTAPDMSQPDPAIGLSEMNLYGYSYEEMLPLTESWALELYDSNNTVYLLYTDNTEAMALDREDIKNHDGIFGIERADWERSPQYAARIAAAASAEGKREADLIYATENMFGIYQIPSGIDAARDFRFATMSELKAHGLDVERKNYELVYTAPFPEQIEHLSDRFTVLNRIYQDFNVNQPADYAARSVSVSDVIVLCWENNVSSHFVDDKGFVPVTGFVGNENLPATVMPWVRPIENNITDATVSPPPAQTVAELKAEVDAGKVISLLDLAKAAQVERRPPTPKSRPSLLGRLDEAKQEVEKNRQTATTGIKKERGHDDV